MENRINNAQNFTGSVFIVNKLSKKPAKCISTERNHLISLIKNEPFDLFIKQDYRENKILLVAKDKKNPQSLETVQSIAANSNRQTYTQSAKAVIENYKIKKDEILWDFWEKKNKPHSLKEKFNSLLQKAEEKFWDVFSDKDEIL